jgi:hypothetical protein
MPGMKEQVTLLTTTRTADAYQRRTVTERMVFAEKLPNYGAEFKTASAGGYELQHIMRVHAYEYGGEKAARYNGQEYEIYRTFQKNDDWVELYLSTKAKKAGATA